MKSQKSQKIMTGGLTQALRQGQSLMTVLEDVGEDFSLTMDETNLVYSSEIK